MGIENVLTGFLSWLTGLAKVSRGSLSRGGGLREGSPDEGDGPASVTGRLRDACDACDANRTADAVVFARGLLQRRAGRAGHAEELSELVVVQVDRLTTG